MQSTPSTSQQAYLPGICNINHAEITRRRKAGHLGVIIFVAVLAVLLLLGINRWVRLLLFVPAFLAAVGYLQAKNKFCVGYGSAGLQNATEGSAHASAVQDNDALAKDRQKTRKINLQSAGVAALATIVVLLIHAL